MNLIDFSRVYLKAAFPALCLCGCAINTANLQTAKSLDEGKVRFAGGISSGLHPEEISYSKLTADNVQNGGEPDRERAYQRPQVITDPDLFNVMFLSALSFHAGVGIGNDLELNSSVSAALMAASARIGLKYQLYNQADHFYAAVNPTALYAISEGGSGPEDEITDGQQTFLQYVLNDKTVFGVELPVLMTWRTRNISYNLSPQLAFYNIDITKAFDANLVGNYKIAAAGLSAGTYFRLRNGAIGPEISLVVLDLLGKEKIVNLNYAIGVMIDI